MNIKEKITSLVSTQEEFDLLYNEDYLYVVRGRWPDDNGIFEIDVDAEHAGWSKLRGPFEGPAKLANNENNQHWCHGFIYFVSEENVANFEKSVVLSSLVTGYQFEKISVSKEKVQLQESHIDSLFEEIV